MIGSQHRILSLSLALCAAAALACVVLLGSGSSSVAELQTGLEVERISPFDQWNEPDEAVTQNPTVPRFQQIDVDQKLKTCLNKCSDRPGWHPTKDTQEVCKKFCYRVADATTPREVQPQPARHSWWARLTESGRAVRGLKNPDEGPEFNANIKKMEPYKRMHLIAPPTAAEEQEKDMAEEDEEEESGDDQGKKEEQEKEEDGNDDGEKETSAVDNEEDDTPHGPAVPLTQKYQHGRYIQHMHQQNRGRNAAKKQSAPKPFGPHGGLYKAPVVELLQISGHGLDTVQFGHEQALNEMADYFDSLPTKDCNHPDCNYKDKQEVKTKKLVQKGHKFTTKDIKHYEKSVLGYHRRHEAALERGELSSIGHESSNIVEDTMSGYRQLEAKARQPPRKPHASRIQHHSSAYQKAKARKGFQGYYHNVFANADDDNNSNQGAEGETKLRSKQDESAHAKLERAALRVVLDENKKLATENNMLARDMSQQEAKANSHKTAVKATKSAAKAAKAGHVGHDATVAGIPVKGIDRAQKTLEEQLKDLERQQKSERLAVENHRPSISRSSKLADKESAEELKQEKTRTAAELKALGAQAKKYQARLMSLLDTSRAHGKGVVAEKLAKIDPLHSATEKELAAALESPTKGSEKAKLDREVKGMLGYDTRKVARLSHAEWDRISKESTF